MSAVRTAVFGLSLVAASALVAPPAHANTDEMLGLGLKAVVSGKDYPAITLQPQTTVKSVVFVLTSGKRSLKIKSGKIKAGKRKVLPIKHEAGVFEWQADATVVWGDKTKTNFKTTFKTTRVGKLSIQITPADVDMDARKLVFRITNPAERAELVILGDNGKRLAVIEEDFDGAAPGAPLKMEWGEVKGDIIRMDLKIWDVAKFWVGLQITPFTIEIPHSDVVFGSGSSAIKQSEAPKLQETMGHIRAALAKHGTLLQLKLFVAGYTDTVSGRAYNQRLSEQRARSISAWFRRKGLKIPIYYQGFGEDVLAVPTPDNTPEVKNRRAIYILSSQVPAVSKAVPRNSWKKL